MNIKLLSIAFIFMLGLAMSSCNGDSDDETTTNGTDTTITNMESDTPMMDENEMDSMDMEGQPTNEDNTGLMPKIQSSYFGVDPQGNEVSYNFLPNNKFERFAFKDGKENLIEGSYKKDGDLIKLSSSSESFEFQKNAQGGYDVLKNGKKSYSVKEIN